MVATLARSRDARDDALYETSRGFVLPPEFDTHSRRPNLAPLIIIIIIIERERERETPTRVDLGDERLASALV